MPERRNALRCTALFERSVALPRGGFAPGLAVAVVCLLATSAAGQMINVAHRAGRNVAWPENTIPDIQWSIAVGADWLEVDVWQSSDGVLVLHHDVSMCRTTNIGSIAGYDCVDPANNPLGRFPQIADFDLTFLKTLDVGSWLDPVFAGIQMPTLEEALLAVKGTGIPLVLDMKTFDQPAKVAQLLQDNGMTQDDVIAWVRYGAFMATQWKAALPNARLFFGYDTPLAVTEQMILDRASAGDFGIVVTSPDLTQSFVDLVHSNGLALMTYPHSAGGLALELQVDMGVDATVIGNPEDFRAFLDSLLCADGIDNDEDGAIDHPADLQCVRRSDRSEGPDCGDGIDNDGDGLVDWPADPGCASSAALTEDPAVPALGLPGAVLVAAGLLAVGSVATLRRVGRPV